ncbi:MAG: DUF4870 domain-containing protein [Bacteroidales bacterium]|nr:DUF4870 domain-containing protein [Bacteroidales bacterium]
MNLVPTKDEKNMGMLCHLLALSGFAIPFGWILGPLIIWLIKKDESEFVNQQGKDALNFQISMLIWMLCCIPLIFIVIGIVLLIMLGILNLVMIIIASVRAADGQSTVYPLSLKIIQ